MLLYKQTRSLRNKNDIKTLLAVFGDVPFSTDYASDFSKIGLDYNSKNNVNFKIKVIAVTIPHFFYGATSS